MLSGACRGLEPYAQPIYLHYERTYSFRGIYRRFEGKLALNCFVIEGGEIAVGDEVQMVKGRACAQAGAFTD
jgi:hypothetical protein